MSGERGELRHRADNAAISRFGEPVRLHLSHFTFNKSRIYSETSKDRRTSVRKAMDDIPSWSQKEQDWKKRFLIDEERHLGTPEQDRGIPVT